MTDGARLYFSVEHLRGHPGGGFSLAQVSVAGGDTVQLASTPDSAIYPVDIDASGSELLVEHSPGTGDAQLAVRPLVSGDERPIGDIRINSGIYGMSATWTPDKSHVIYVKGSQLRTARNDGSESRGPADRSRSSVRAPPIARRGAPAIQRPGCENRGDDALGVGKRRLQPSPSASGLDRRARPLLRHLDGGTDVTTSSKQTRISGRGPKALACGRCWRSVCRSRWGRCVSREWCRAVMGSGCSWSAIS